MIETIWEIMVNLLESTIFILFFTRIFSVRSIYTSYRHFGIFGAIIIETAITCFCNINNMNYGFVQLLLLLFDLLLLLALFDGSLAKKVYVSILPTLISLIADKLSFSLCDQLFASTLRSFDLGGDHRYCSTFVYLLICALFCILFAKLMKADLMMSSFLYAATYITSILGVICCNILLDILITYEKNIPQNIFFRLQGISFSVMIIILFMILLIFQISATNKRNADLVQKQHQEQTVLAELQHAKETADGIRAWKHDYKNHLLTLKGLAANHKDSQITQYIQSLQDNLPDYLNDVNTGVASIDASVSGKIRYARSQHIELKHSLLVNDKMPLSDLQLTTILGNLLDNAIEACIRLQHQDPAAQPSIVLSMKPFRAALQIIVQNTSTGEYLTDKDHALRTSKADTSQHGFGLLNVQKTVEAANGIIDITKNSTSFCVTILIPEK